MKRITVCLVFLMLAMLPSFAQVELWINRVEEEGRLLVPVRGVFEATGAAVEWDSRTSGVHILGGGNDIWMWVNDQNAALNDDSVWLDVPPRNHGGRVYIPLRFVGESLGRSVGYMGDRVVLSAPYAADIILHIQGTPPPPPPRYTGEMMSQSDERYVTNADLAGWSNWNLTLVRNEIYARHGRPFNNDYIRRYFNSTGRYTPNPNFRESWLTPLESRNAAFIADYQKRVFGSAATHP